MLALIRKILTIALFCGISFFSLLSIPIKKIGFKEGISNSYINGITQDRDGFIWFATEWGLNRFDGKNFVVYENNPSDSSSISDNRLNDVLADDKEGVIWIATKSKGLSAFDKRTNRFINFPISKQKPNAIKANGITALCFGKMDILWIGTHENGLKKLDKRTNIVAHYTKYNFKGLVSDNILSIAIDSNENLYLAHIDRGMSIISFRDSLVKNFTHKANDPNSIPDNHVNQIFIDSKNNIWVATQNGLALYNPQTEKFTVYQNQPKNPHSLTDNNVSRIMEVNNTLWIGTQKRGISILDMQNLPYSSSEAVFKNIYANDFPDGLSNPMIISLFHDIFGNIWIGTFGGSINFISHQESFFKTLSYSFIKGDQNGLSNKIAWGICSDNEKKLWVGTQGGGIDVYKAGKKIQHYCKEDNNLPDNFLTSALADSEGEIWFCTESKGILRFNKAQKKFEKFVIPDSSLHHTWTRCIFEDNLKNVWVGSNGGVIKHNLTTKKTNTYPTRSIGLPNNLIRSISQDKNGHIWIGSLINGLSIVTTEFKLIRNFNSDNGFPSNYINHIYKDSEGKMWVATSSGLVYFYDMENLNYRVLNKRNGLSNDFIKAIIEGKAGEIWFSTNTGINRFHVKSGKTDNYDQYENIPEGVFMNGSVTKSLDGFIYFGSQNGICYFNPDIDPVIKSIPVAKITDFKIYEPQKRQDRSIVSIPISPKIKLKYNQNTFTIDFNVMDFALKDMVIYLYSLKGLDNSWYQTNDENQVTFRNLPPGRYRLEVKARIRNQDFSKNTTTLSIYIAPPFWLSWWAKALYVTIAALIVFFIVRFYKRKLNLENQLYLEKENHHKDKDLNDEKLRFYTNIAHELRTPLTLILGPLEDLTADKRLETDQTRKISLIYKSVSRLSNLTNQILEFRKSETNNRKLCVTCSDILPLLHEVILKYKEVNQNKAVFFSVYAEAKSINFYFDSEVLTIILDNLISNALKYTFEGLICIYLRNVTIENKLWIEIEVKDTGVGIPEKALLKIFDPYYQVKGEYQAFGTGIGLSLVKNMIQLHEGRIDVKSKEEEGTSFFIRLLAENTYPEAIHIEENKRTSEQSTDSKPILLIVEDNSDIREYIANSFIDDFDILTAENGETGIVLAFEKLPDIIICDVVMPIMDGIILTKTLKEDMRTCHIPIILLTARDSLQDRTEGYSTGADSYLTKPFSAKLLHTRVANLLESREKVKNIFSASAYKKSVMESALNELDNEFVAKTIHVIEENLDSETVNITYLADQMNMSHSTFYRKIKALTGLTANEFNRKIKMQHAEKMILSRRNTLSEIAFKLGFNGSDSLRKAFKAEFGYTPSEFLKKMENENKK